MVNSELAAVNNMALDSTDAYKAMLRNLGFALSLYSEQMCTTSRALFVPAEGSETDQGHKGFDAFASDLASAINALLGKAVLATRKVDHPEFPAAQIRTPLPAACAADDPAWQRECFGGISFLVRVANSAAAIGISERPVSEQGALSINLTDGVSVNQSTAFSAYHGSEGDPTADASYAAAAFVANRLRVVQRRHHL